MNPRRPWKIILLSIFAVAMVAGILFWRDQQNKPKQSDISQWEAPEANPGAKSKQLPFPEPKKVLTPEEIRSGHWGNEEKPQPEKAEENSHQSN